MIRRHLESIFQAATDPYIAHHAREALDELTKSREVTEKITYPTEYNGFRVASHKARVVIDG